MQNTGTEGGKNSLPEVTGEESRDESRFDSDTYKRIISVLEASDQKIIDDRMEHLHSIYDNTEIIRLGDIVEGYRNIIASEKLRQIEYILEKSGVISQPQPEIIPTENENIDI